MDFRNRIANTVAAVVIILSPSIAFAEQFSYSSQFNLPIPASPAETKGWMTDAVIDITDHLIISDLDLTINLTHTNIFDLQIFLQSPADTIICLNNYSSYEFFQSENYTDVTFDDEAPLPISQAPMPLTGRWQPITGNPLAAFDNEDAFGSWHLRIYDAHYNDTGTLENFEILITNPEPATAALLALGIAIVRFSKPSRRS